MPIVVSKLISAAMLQDLLVNKEGQPLAAGIITLYQPDKVTLKNWYYDAGTVGAPNYIALPNPMTLSAAGTIVDVNGNDTIPFYYPWSETNPNIAQLYFIKVYDAFGQLQFTRINFPSVNGGGGPIPTTTVPNFQNFIINNRFWRNLGSTNMSTLPFIWTTQYNNAGTFYYITVCPDQHDGFSMPDVNYIRDSNSGVSESVFFQTFPKTSTPILTGDIDAEFYINHICTSDGSGSTFKAYQFPITLHLATLAAETFSFTMQGVWTSGAFTVGIYLYQFCGTGVASPAPVHLGDISLTSTWQKYTLPGLVFPGTTGLTIGSDGTGGADDAYYLQIRMPAGQACNIGFTLPSIYLTADASTLPTNSFQTYDQIDSVVAAPRMGDIKISLNNFYPFGWVPLSGGTLAHGNTLITTIVPPTGLSIAYQGEDSWPLYNLIWNAFSALRVNSTLLINIYSSAGNLTTYGATSYADWQALKQIALTQTLGQVILGTVPVTAMNTLSKQTYVASNSGGKYLFTLPGAPIIFAGMPFVLYNTGGAPPATLALNTVYYVGIGFTVSTFFIATSFANALAGTFINFGDPGSGTQSLSFGNAGTFEGEYGHFQLTSEVGVHGHAGSNIVGAGGEAESGFGVGVITTTASAYPVTVANNQLLADQTQFNVTQPGTFYNIFMKL